MPSFSFTGASAAPSPALANVPTPFSFNNAGSGTGANGQAAQPQQSSLFGGAAQGQQQQQGQASGGFSFGNKPAQAPVSSGITAATYPDLRLIFRRLVGVYLVNRQIPHNLTAVSSVSQQIPNLPGAFLVNRQIPLNPPAGSSVNPLRLSLQPPEARVCSAGSSPSSRNSSPVCLDKLSKLKRVGRLQPLCLVV